MKTKKLFKLFLMAITLTFLGCYPEEPGYIDEYDLVLTNYDAGFAFAGHSNYAMPDSILKVTGEGATGNPLVFIAEPYSSSILNRIESNMSALGYTRVSDTAQADLILFPAAMEVLNVDYYYSYYGYYWGWYYPGYYGYYYPYPMVTTYTTGTLLMQLVVRGEVSPTGKLHAAWSGAINGLLEGYGTDFNNRINKGIDQAFTQSQYLHQ